jgi:WD40 repeat protein
MVLSLALAPGGQLLASGGSDTTVRLWGADGKRRGVYSGQPAAIYALAFSPGGRKLAVSGTGSLIGFLPDGELRLWDVRAAKEVLVLRGSSCPANGMALSPDGRTLAAGGKNGVVLWEVASGKVRKALRGRRKVVPHSHTPQTVAS